MIQDNKDNSKKGTGSYMIFITLIIALLDLITWFTLKSTDVILIINTLVLIMLTASIRYNQNT